MYVYHYLFTHSNIPTVAQTYSHTSMFTHMHAYVHTCTCTYSYTHALLCFLYHSWIVDHQKILDLFVLPRIQPQWNTAVAAAAAAAVAPVFIFPDQVLRLCGRLWMWEGNLWSCQDSGMCDSTIRLMWMCYFEDQTKWPWHHRVLKTNGHFYFPTISGIIF